MCGKQEKVKISRDGLSLAVIASSGRFVLPQMLGLLQSQQGLSYHYHNSRLCYQGEE